MREGKSLLTQEILCYAILYRRPSRRRHIALKEGRFSTIATPHSASLSFSSELILICWKMSRRIVQAGATVKLAHRKCSLADRQQLRVTEICLPCGSKCELRVWGAVAAWGLADMQTVVSRERERERDRERERCGSSSISTSQSDVLSGDTRRYGARRRRANVTFEESAYR